MREGRTLVDSFIEGFVAPWLEFYLTLIILSVKTAILIMKKALEQLPGSLGRHLITTPDVLQIIAIALVIMAIVDFIRNLIVGYLLPAHTLAHILGEICSLVMFFSTILRSAPGLIHYTVLEASSSVYLSIAVMLLGILVRTYVEQVNRESTWY
ncbi:MAG: hypothetical protein DRJ51_04180 [Thermoprotei archaeon]|nr:MAG: hypothetical protein DRJ51_04180 [Thermoprotei archaeon]